MSPIKEVTYFEASCDDCGETGTDTGSDYSAWADHGQAIEDWTNHDGWRDYDSNWLLCWTHAPRCPECGDVEWDDEPPCDCEQVSR